MSHEDIYVVGDHIESALHDGKPIVALESTVITHGLPYPQNLETARQLEAAVRSEGAVPATIAISGRRIIIGADDDLLSALSQADDAIKLNLSNLAAGVASGAPGSTTVAATMHIAAEAGIMTFATGGIGGVHRGVAESFDISADLGALAKYPIAVVCAGAKAILDLQKTREALESLGVPIFGWQTSELPAFYRRESGISLDFRFDDMVAMSEAVTMHWELGFDTGVLIGNPIPEADALPLEVYEKALADSLRQADEAGVVGREITPFLLEAMRRNSEGASVFANTTLLENNARVAARLAIELAKLDS